MIDSDLALSFAFAAVTNLARLHDLRPQQLPATSADLRKSEVEPTSEVFHAILDAKDGSSFWIRDGIVHRFVSSESFLQRRDDRDVERFRGEPKVGSNDVVQIATRTVSQLSRDWNPTRGFMPDIGRQTGLHEEAMPFFWVSWPATNKGGLARYSALVEVDARSGYVTYFDLTDKGFYDRELLLTISNRIYKSDPFVQRRPRPPNLPPPETNQVLAAIPGWLRLCSDVGIDPGRETNLAGVAWDTSYAYTNQSSPDGTLECFVVFRSGASLRAAGNVAFAASAPDACFVGPWQQQPREYFDRYKATVTKNWKDLAGELQKRLTEKAAIPQELFEEFKPNSHKRPPQIGTEALTRLVVDWRWWPKRGEFVSIEESKLGMTAEFDLKTGQIKSINLAPEETKFLHALRQPYARTKN